MASSQSTQSLITQIVRQVRMFQLTTTSAVTATLARGNRLRAKRYLEGLVTDGRLHRHLLSDPTGKLSTPYFTLKRSPLDATVARSCIALLWYCRGQQPQRKLLSPSKVAQLAEAVCFDPMYKALAKLHMVIEPPAGSAPPRIEMIRFRRRQAPGDVSAPALHNRLSRFVAREPFLPWRHYARAERFVLTYLVPGQADVADLTAYFDGHPLTITFDGEPLYIPVRFVETRPLFPGHL